MSYKQARVGGRIRVILSELLLREVADPRLHGITINEVKLDPEMQSAKVYVSGYDEDPKEVMLGLKSANSFLRREVGKRVHLRKTPELHFVWDATAERGERINALIDSLDIPDGDSEDQLPADRDEPGDGTDGLLGESTRRGAADPDSWDDVDLEADDEDDGEWDQDDLANDADKNLADEDDESDDDADSDDNDDDDSDANFTDLAERRR